MAPATPERIRARDWKGGLLSAACGALLLAAASTAADAIWAAWSLPHRTLYGLVHGTALFSIFGLYLAGLGRTKRGLVVGLVGGPAAGLAAAAFFYLLAPWMRMAAMFPAWALLWVLLAVVSRLVIQNLEPWTRTVARGLAAALTSGLAFYAISDIWRRPPPGGPDYAFHFLCWTVAFLPGFVALLAGSARAQSPVRPGADETT